MQIHCHYCRYPFVVNPQGGQFRCPTCGSVNSVGSPFHHEPIPTPHGASLRRTKPDHRPSVAIIASAFLNILAFGLSWYGLALGLSILGWSIAAALGKVKSPGELLFPESSKRAALLALGVMLGILTTGAAIMGGRYEHQKAADEARAEEERAAAEAGERARLAAKEAELRENAPKAAQGFHDDLTEAARLFGAGNFAGVQVRLRELKEASLPYRSLVPVPPDIEGLFPREEALSKAVATGTRLEENLRQAASLTVANNDGKRWADAARLWKASLVDLDELDRAAEAGLSLPQRLVGKREVIEEKVAEAKSVIEEFGKFEESVARVPLASEIPTPREGAERVRRATGEEHMAARMEPGLKPPKHRESEGWSTTVLGLSPREARAAWCFEWALFRHPDWPDKKVSRRIERSWDFTHEERRALSAIWLESRDLTNMPFPEPTHPAGVGCLD